MCARVGHTHTHQNEEHTIEWMDRARSIDDTLMSLSVPIGYGCSPVSNDPEPPLAANEVRASVEEEEKRFFFLFRSKEKKKDDE